MTRLHPFARRVQRYIDRERLIAQNDSLLVGVSGGPDSVALLHVLASLKELCCIRELAVLHFDHQLRGEDSSEDRDFVAALAENFRLPFHTASEDVAAYGKRHRLSVEMAARACRHGFFREALSRLKADSIALGHNADDQAEEILLRLIRGTGPSGMAGMHPRTASQIVRPLLFATRIEILAYLEDQELSFREDASNRDPAHQRNVLRHMIIPDLKTRFHPRIVEVLARHGRLAAEEDSCWEGVLAIHWEKVCITESPHEVVLNAGSLLGLHPALQKRLLRRAVERLQTHLQGIYAVHIEALCGLLHRSTAGRRISLPRGLGAELEGKFLVLSREPRESSPVIDRGFDSTIRGPGRHRFPFLELDLSLVDVPPDPEGMAFSHVRNAVHMDAETLNWPLYLKFWEKGDRFYPLGLGGSKKLQDFFVDSRVSEKLRRRIPLLCDQEKICWVVGYRLDDRVKITPGTKRILVVQKTDTAAPDSEP